MDTMMLVTDARVVRTRAALDRAVTELAAAIPIHEITVSQLAEAAGINRVTFYKHFDSPSEALARSLESDLRKGSERADDSPSKDADPIDVLRAALCAALDHIDRFESVYQTQLSTKFEGVLHPVLTEYFAEVIRSTSLEAASSDEADARRTLAEYFLAHGIAGTITGWKQNVRIDREDLVAIVLRRLPDDLFQRRS